MIISHEIRKRMRHRSPFEPFRIRLKDGRSFDILYPEMHLAAEKEFNIGIVPTGAKSAFPAYWERVAYDSIEDIEPMPHVVPPDIMSLAIKEDQ